MKNLFANNKFILNLMLLGVFGGINMGILHIVINLYCINLGATSSQLGIIRSAQGLSVLLMVLPVGFFIDHFGARKLFMLGGWVSALVILFFPLVKSVQIIPFFTAIMGLVGSMRFTSMSSVFLTHLKGMGNGKAGWFRGSQSIGLMFLGPLLAGYLVKSLNFTMSFVLLSVFTVAIVIFAFFVFAKKSDYEKKFFDPVVFSFKDIVKNLKLLLRNRTLVRASAAEGVSIMCFSCYTTFIIAMALRVFGLSQQAAVSLVAAQGLAFISTVFLGGFLLDKYPVKKLYLVSLLILALASLILGLTKEVKFLWLGAFIFGIGLGVVNVINLACLANIEGKKGKITGFFSLSTSMGIVLGSFLGGIIGDVFGIQAIFLALAPVCLIAGLILHK
ncbi:MAG: MFS transporter [Candidatus Omnitrophica bacterium]|nr:MFS transporter [Candidatus Omnitrophota bacterium]